MNGECEIRDEPKKIPPGDYTVMMNTFDGRRWKLADGSNPGRSYLEKKLETV